MTWRMLLAVTAGVTVAATGLRGDSAEQDMKKLQGTWRLVSGVNQGKPLSEKVLKGALLVIKGDGHKVKVGDVTYVGRHKLDPDKKPRTIDITDTEGPFKGKTVHGIYELIGDEFRLCYALPGKARPKTFAAKASSGHRFHVWKREKK